jgi:uncharacterized protein (TIGR00255 family)
MILSMTGFGRSGRAIGPKELSIELRALNSRYLDLNLRLPAELRNAEPEIRQMLARTLIRGKIDLVINIEGEGLKTQKIDTKLISDYYAQLKSLQENLGDDAALLPSILQFPDVLKPVVEEADEKERNLLLEALGDAIEQVLAFRRQEGDATEKDMRKKIGRIMELLKEIEEADEARKIHVRERLNNLLKDLPSGSYDEKRMEEEILYYLEKMDINEEKVRLKNHCNYFLEILDKEEKEKGKQLNFILQEIGREINTIGSKAGFAAIQRKVVQMKDELEKMKEQVLNIV